MNLQQTQDQALADRPLVVEDPACLGITTEQLDAEPTPIWDQLVSDITTPLPGTNLAFFDIAADLV